MTAEAPLSFRRVGYALTLGMIACACSSGSGDRPSGIVDDASGGRGQAADGGRSGMGSAGSGAREAGDGGEPDRADGGSAGTDTGSNPGTGQPPLGPAACSERGAWTDSKIVDVVSSAAPESFLSVTPDELDLAFVRSGSVYLAHRAQAAAPFSMGGALAIPAGWSVAQGASLSADGKRLLLVSDPDQKKLGEMRRPTRDAAFAGGVDESAFAAVNQDAVYTGKQYAFPVVSFSDTQLFYNSSFAGGSSTIVVSTGSAGAAWSAPVVLTTLVFDGTASQRRLPTGLSADARTLFYFNERTQLEEARFRDMPSVASPFYDLVELGARRAAAPNTACDRLYFGAENDIVVEKD